MNIRWNPEIARTFEQGPRHALTVLNAIADMQRAGKQGMLSRDFVDSYGFTEPTIRRTLHWLQAHGYISVTGGGQGRTKFITLSTQGKLATRKVGYPVFGSIPAGVPLEAVQDDVEYVEKIEDLFGNYCEGDFMLKVRGDSMLGDNIVDGDYVLLRPGVEVEQDEIAAVYVNEEGDATLKHVRFLEDGRVRLWASNPEYSDIVVPASDFRVAGVYIGLARSGRTHARRWDRT